MGVTSNSLCIRMGMWSPRRLRHPPKQPDKSTTRKSITTRHRSERTGDKPMKTFTDRVAAITGAGSAMGRSLAIRLAREGCHLALTDRNATSLAETAQLAQAAAPHIVGSPLRITTRVLDVSDRAAMFDWAAETATQHQRVNLVFNNAGVALSSTIEGMEYADLEWIVN